MKDYAKAEALNQALLATNENLIYWLKQHAADLGDTTAICLVTDDGEKDITYAEFEARVRAVAAELVSQTEKGDRAVLLFDNDDNYAVAFYACLYAGVIAVPVFPPQSTQAHHLQRLTNIVKDAEPSIVLTTSMIMPMVTMFSKQFGVERLLAVDTVDIAKAKDWENAERGEHELAFLQYTSGSTGMPKGVMVTHENLLANELAILKTMPDSNIYDDSIVSWLPIYHDMGLIGGLLGPLFRGGKLVLMSPLLFLRKPEVWLKSISKHRGTVTAAPDFAYRLCYERIDDEVIAELDLSSVKYMLSGAEPVREDTLQQFIKRFAQCGFNPKAFAPCYGLAEATLFVSGTPIDKTMRVSDFDAGALKENRVVCLDGNAVDSDKSNRLVSSGVIAQEHIVSIVNSQTLEELPTGHVGEILVSGSSVAAGYWKNPEATEKAFVEISGKRWVRTGDMGFLLEGELFITGRIKDIIILNGRNYYPQDIEQGVEAEIEIIKQGRSVAFSVETPEGGEGIGIAVEIATSMQKFISPESLVEEVNKVILQYCQQPASVVLLLNPKSIPKTSSGKLQRSACKQQWIDGSLNCFAKVEFGDVYTNESGELTKKKV